MLAELQHTPGVFFMFFYFFLPVFAAGNRNMSRLSVQHAALFFKSSPSTLNVNQCFAYSNCTVNSTWGISL